MNPILLANLLGQLGTVGIPYIVKLMQDISAGRSATTVTEADLIELARLDSLTSKALWSNAGVALPPSATTP